MAPALRTEVLCHFPFPNRQRCSKFEARAMTPAKRNARPERGKEFLPAATITMSFGSRSVPLCGGIFHFPTKRSAIRELRASRIIHNGTKFSQHRQTHTSGGGLWDTRNISDQALWIFQQSFSNRPLPTKQTA